MIVEDQGFNEMVLEWEIFEPVGGRNASYLDTNSSLNNSVVLASLGVETCGKYVRVRNDTLDSHAI
jgi:hypothetical protein